MEDKVSDNANVPRQALEQLERLEALEAQQVSPPVITEQTPAAPNADATIVDPAAQTETSNQPVVTEPAPPTERTDWKAKYLVLKGKFDADVPRFAAENRQLRATIQQLTSDLNAAKANAAPATGNTAPKEGLESQFDPELVQFVRDQIEAGTKPLRQELDTTREVQAKSAQQIFVDSVTELVPDYAEIDASDAFQEWASDLDVVSGSTYGELLDDAILKRNAARVKAIYDKFRSEKVGVAKPQTPPAQPFVPAPLENRVVPQPSVDNGASIVEKPNFTRAQVAKFYGDRARGVYAGRETEADEIEAQITLAQQEGRVE
jgi:hypothetical protein